MEEIKKNIRTWGWRHRVFELKRFEERGYNFYFL